ncbi:MAG: VOC family protein [Candidatus Kariarchaeaceae archaeon]|jgi:hypothetical protein
MHRGPRSKVSYESIDLLQKFPISDHQSISLENTFKIDRSIEDEFALIFELNDVLLRINYLPDFTPKEFTAMGWIVDDIVVKIQKLNGYGVIMERYDMFDQDELGIATIPDGTKLAYFKDPDSNILSLTQFP